MKPDRAFDKIKTLDELANTIQVLKDEGNIIVHCHGGL
jgi:protein-tyrosine phosphatase